MEAELQLELSAFAEPSANSIVAAPSSVGHAALRQWGALEPTRPAAGSHLPGFSTARRGLVVRRAREGAVVARERSTLNGDSLKNSGGNRFQPWDARAPSVGPRLPTSGSLIKPLIGITPVG